MPPKKNKYGKHIFTLKIDVEKVEHTYNFSIVSNIQNNNIFVDGKGTKLSEIISSSEPETISFLDDAKKSHTYVLTMNDCVKNETLPEHTNICCFWDKHTFATMPIGCPVKYISSQLEKTYYSEITKDKYTIRENISEKLDTQNLNVSHKNYYETDGIFCSFNCVMSFINEEMKKSDVERFLYKDSKYLLSKMYFELFNKFPKDLIPAPSWRLLKSFGGHLDIFEYRNGFNKVEYTENIHKIKELPTSKPISFLYEKKTKL